MRRTVIVGGLLVWLATSLVVPTGFAEPVRIQRHALDLQLEPDRHGLIAQDTITLTGTLPEDRVLRFVLNRALTVEEVKLGSKPVSFEVHPSADGFPEMLEASEASHIQQLKVPLHGSSGGPLPGSVTVVYRGRIHDPPRSSKGLRFVRPDHTQGHIGPEGVYLSSESFWYPLIPDSLPQFEVRVRVPGGWEAVTQGRRLSHRVEDGQVITEWVSERPAEALTLAANRFVISRRLWQGIELTTYLFPEDAHLAPEYLDATVRYLSVYSTILGPYPFAKFAVVENFFPSGLGIPSFTLLGSRVVKRKYVQPYSLGHEIVHSWIGNAVLNRKSSGNWVEGLTTYLANYYYDELYGEPGVASAHRRKMIMSYGLYVRESEDYPLIQFHHKETPRDNAIGYQKAAMVFHMLRRELGDAVFFQAIRGVIDAYQGRYAGWEDLQQACERASGRNLQWFFRQWVFQSGAPQLKLSHAAVRPVARHNARFVVDGDLVQQGMPYRVQVPLVLLLENGDMHRIVVPVVHDRTRFSFDAAARPVRLLLDPEFEVFRRVERAHLPPTLNGWVTDVRRAVVEPHDRTGEAWEAYRGVLTRIEREESSITRRVATTGAWGRESLLILGDPERNRLTGEALESCHPHVKLEDGQVVIHGRAFAGPEVAVLISCPHPIDPNHVLTVFFGNSPQAVGPVARLLFFYGWDSYVVFRNGRVVARGDLWSLAMKEGVQFDAS